MSGTALNNGSLSATMGPNSKLGQTFEMNHPMNQSMMQNTSGMKFIPDQGNQGNNGPKVINNWLGGTIGAPNA